MFIKCVALTPKLEDVNTFFPKFLLSETAVREKNRVCVHTKFSDLELPINVSITFMANKDRYKSANVVALSTVYNVPCSGTVFLIPETCKTFSPNQVLRARPN